MAVTTDCTHPGSARSLDRKQTFAFNGPHLICKCCGGMQFYADSASWTKQAYRGRFWSPKNLCGGCGGGYVDEAFDYEIPAFGSPG